MLIIFDTISFSAMSGLSLFFLLMLRCLPRLMMPADADVVRHFDIFRYAAC